MDHLEKATLDFCNEVRARFGLESQDALVPGYRVAAGDCPVAATIGMGAHACQSWVYMEKSYWYAPNVAGPDDIKYKNIVGELPREVSLFMSAFDNDKYPSLIANATVEA